MADTKDDRKNIFDKLLKDKEGHFVFAQRPNLPIIVWAVARLAIWPLGGRAEDLAKVVAFGALFTWAWMELFMGVNYARRVLGLVVLVFTVSSAVMAGHLI